MTIPAATFFCALLFGLGMFQLLLAAGAPVGHFAWGGQNRVLPVRLRLGSVVSAALYAAFAMVALDRAGLIAVLPDQVVQIAMWVVVGVLVLGTIPNLISRSTPERYVMAPLSLLLSGLGAVIALGW